jgi:LemA protein
VHALIVLIVVLVVLALFVVGIYNSLINLRNRVDNAWHQIDVQLRRRYDLIPNLVETVKGYAAHERETFERVTEARARCVSAGSVREQGQAENVLTGALRQLFAVAENYPELKANQNFLMLQEELAGTEGKIAYSRQFYNDSVMTLNAAIQRFPNNLVAHQFGFQPRDYFEIEEAQAREPVHVSFARTETPTTPGEPRT